MEHQCRWFSHLEDVRDHQPESVLWYKQGCEEWPVIFPAGVTPIGPFIRIGTIEELLAAMQQTLATDSRLRQSMQQNGGIIIQAQINGQGTVYQFSSFPRLQRGWLNR
jgi:hypothetical protein